MFAIFLFFFGLSVTWVIAPDNILGVLMVLGYAGAYVVGWGIWLGRGVLFPGDSETNLILPLRNQRAEIIRVIDGDSLEVQIENEVGDLATVPLRLAHIDAPELAQDGGKSASAYLHRLVLEEGRSILIDADEFDRFGRLVAAVRSLNGVSLNATMVDHGYAFAYPWSPDSSFFEQLQANAQSLSRGMWSGGADILEPWAFRKQRAN